MKKKNESRLITTPKEEESIQINWVPKDRIFQRSQGCWNCKNWNCGQMAMDHYKKRRFEDAKILLEKQLNKGETFEAASTYVDSVLKMQDDMITPPKSGICIGGGAKAEFTMAGYLCDRWTGRVVVEGADTLAEELYDKKGEKM